MKRIFAVILLLLSWGLKAQNHGHNHGCDTLNCSQYFKKGHIGGHVRNYFMSTINEGVLTDYWTDASGMALHYQSVPFWGFHIGVEGIFTFETLTGDLLKVDSITGKSARWEAELYDVLDPENKVEMDRLDQLYLQYDYDSLMLKYGKMEIDGTPLLNKRDGRMKAFAFQGFLGRYNFKHQQTYLGWIEGVSPRSTVEWFSLHEAIGLNNNGFTPNGTKADYHEKVHLSGLAMAGWEGKWESLHWRLWNYYLHEIFNITWSEVNYNLLGFDIGFQYVHQRTMDHQKSLSIENRYMNANTPIHVVSGRLGKMVKNWKFTLAHTEIRGKGVFVFPRELGRDDLFTSMPRSRADGLGNSSFDSGRIQYTPRGKKLSGFVESTWVRTPGSDEYLYNKYGIRDYFQSNVRVSYKPVHRWTGLEIALLYVWRLDTDEGEPTALDAFNQTNFHQFNLVTNINF